jgi:hypothetical protein
MSRTVRVLVVVWVSALAAAIALNDDRVETQGAQITEAPTGFTGSNGFLAEFCSNQANLVNSPNSPMIPPDECNDDVAVEEFTGPETIADGLGPIFNAAGCGECHIVPVLGGSTQLTEKRATRARLPPRRQEHRSTAVLLEWPTRSATRSSIPFSDFLLHDIGTGDGIVQNGGLSTRNKVRTAPLWGLHTRGRFMHDASSFSLTDVIDRHRGQASTARSAFFGLSSANRNRLLTFLQSL